jgi:hypothetical protein
MNKTKSLEYYALLGFLHQHGAPACLIEYAHCGLTAPPIDAGAATPPRSKAAKPNDEAAKPQRLKIHADAQTEKKDEIDPTPWTEEDKERFSVMLNEGKTTSEICALLKKSKQQLYQMKSILKKKALMGSR